MAAPVTLKVLTTEERADKVKLKNAIEKRSQRKALTQEEQDMLQTFDDCFKPNVSELGKIFSYSLNLLPSTIWSVDTKEMEYLQDIFAYDGFDPRRTAWIIMKGISATATNEKKLDVMAMIVLCIERGNLIKKIRNRTGDEGQKFIDKLIEVYNIQEKAKDKNTITLARVVLSFAWLSCSYMEYARNPPISHEDMLKIAPGYPKHMMTAAFANMIPDSASPECTIPVEDLNELRAAYLLHQAMFGVLISGNQKKNFKTILSSAEGFALAGIGNKMIPTAERIKWLRTWKIIDSNDKVSKDVANAAKVCKTMATQ